MVVLGFAIRGDGWHQHGVTDGRRDRRVDVQKRPTLNINEAKAALFADPGDPVAPAAGDPNDAAKHAYGAGRVNAKTSHEAV